MSLLNDITKAGYGAARAAGKAGSVSNDVNNILNGRLDRVAKKHLKRLAFKDMNKAINAGLKLFK